jgi:hypothetical protein
MSRTLEYIVLLLICGTLTYMGATYVAKAISTSMTHTADLIANAS